MTDVPFLKCPCQMCGGSIEFPAQGVGLRIECPHCGQKTVLTGPAAQEDVTSPVASPASPTPQPAPEAAPQPGPATSKSLLLAVTLLALGALAGGAIWYFKVARGQKRGETASAANPPKAAPTRATNEAPPKETTLTTNAPKIEKSIDDLKPGSVTLEKAKAGSLMYAVGTVKNDSPHQRFGVRVEIEFTDAKGRPAGKASDYTQVIEPHREWRFRALVLDSKAAGGKVIGIKEDN